MIDFKGLFVAFGLACALAGWAVIEGALWLLSHVSITLTW